MIIPAALSRTETIKKGFQITHSTLLLPTEMSWGQETSSSWVAPQPRVPRGEAAEMLAEIVTNSTVELPTQAKYKEEDNSNVEKFKEFPVMYSHYGPN